MQPILISTIWETISMSKITSLKSHINNILITFIKNFDVLSLKKNLSDEAIKPYFRQSKIWCSYALSVTLPTYSINKFHPFSAYKLALRVEKRIGERGGVGLVGGGREVDRAVQHAEGLHARCMRKHHRWREDAARRTQVSCGNN